MDNLLCLRPVVLFTKDFACSSCRTLTKKSNKIRVDQNDVFNIILILSWIAKEGFRDHYV